MRNLLLVRAYARAWEEECYRFFTIQNTILSATLFALPELVSWCFEVFLKNDVSFYEKWRVVLWKVTCRFMRNDVSFYEKWCVVLWETTCCFMNSLVLFVEQKYIFRAVCGFSLLRVWVLFSILSRSSPLCQRLTTKHLLNNRIKSVPDLMSDLG